MQYIVNFITFLVVLAAVVGLFGNLGLLIYGKVKGNQIDWRKVVWLIICVITCIVFGPATSDAFLWLFKTVMDLIYFSVMFSIAYVIVTALHHRR